MEVPFQVNSLYSTIELYLENDKYLTQFENSDLEKLKYTAGPFLQFSLLYKRALTKCIRQKELCIIRYAVQLFFAILSLILYYDVYFIIS